MPATLASESSRLLYEGCAQPGRWQATQRQIREPWLAMARESLTELGMPPAQVTPYADLIFDTLDGLLLDRLVGTNAARTDAAAAAFANLLR
jgi:hypothetical protein